MSLVHRDSNDNIIVQDESYARGLYLGIVEENNDPLVMGRLRVRIPEIHGARNAPNKISNAALSWSLPCFTDAGEYRVPTINTFVWCLAQNENVDNWVWLGVCPTLTNRDSIFSGHGDQSTVPLEAKQSLKSSSKNPLVKEFKSKSGHFIIIDDTPGKERIEIKTLSGHDILLNDVAGATKLKLTDKNANIIELDSETNNLNVTVANNGSESFGGSTNKSVTGSGTETYGTTLTINVNGGNAILNVPAGNVDVIASGTIDLGSAGVAPASGCVTGTTHPICLVTGSPISHSVNVGARD